MGHLTKREHGAKYVTLLCPCFALRCRCTCCPSVAPHGSSASQHLPIPRRAVPLVLLVDAAVFTNANSFNVDIGSWNISQTTNMEASTRPCSVPCFALRCRCGVGLSMASQLVLPRGISFYQSSVMLSSSSFCLMRQCFIVPFPSTPTSDRGTPHK